MKRIEFFSLGKKDRILYSEHLVKQPYSFCQVICYSITLIFQMMGVRRTGSSSSVHPPTGCTQGPNHTFSSEDKRKEIPSGGTKEDVYYDVLFVLHLWIIHSQICFRGLPPGEIILLRGPAECMLRKVCD